MGKVRHRKRTRDARVAATVQPLVGTDSSAAQDDEQTKARKVPKKEQDIATLVDKLRSPDSRDRVWASSTLSSLLLTLPPIQQRLILSKNLIGLLIERLTLPVPSSSSSPPPPPPSDDLTTALESLGALRNLAVSSPPHILSEMHNKRLLLPLTSVHLPLLASYLPAQLLPAPPPLKPSLPATPAERQRVELANEGHETLRAGYWDWAENCLTLLWSLAESNTKILAALNTHAAAIVGLCLGFLQEGRLGLEKSEGEDGMEVEAGAKKHKKKDAKEKEKKKGAKVPLFVAVAAAQTLHAFLSSNPPAHSHLLSSSATGGFSPALSSLLSILLAPSSPYSSAPSSASSAHPASPEDWAQLRVLAFGILLELAKGRSKRRDVETVREALRGEEAQGVLLGLVGEASALGLEKIAEEGKKVAGEIDPTALPSSHPTPDSPAFALQAVERRTQTLQLALEVLSEWLASGVPNSSTLAGGDFDGADEDAEEGMDAEEDEEEEWGGISMDVEEGDVAMGEDGDDDLPEGADEDGIIRKRLPGEDEDAMLDDMAATAASGEDSDSDDEDAADKPAIKLLGGSLPLQLLALSQPSSLSFLPPSAFADPLAPSGETLIATSTSSALPAALGPLAEALTTVPVRALEALNNLYVTLARAKARRDVGKELQRVFETAAGLMLGALQAAEAHPAPQAAVGGKKKGVASAAAAQQEEADEVQERRMEVVMAGAGVVWGCVRLGLDAEAKEQLTIGPSTAPFLVDSVFPSPFAAAPTPAGEAIRVRALGALGVIGRRRGVPVEENKQIGAFLLSLLPLPPSAAAPAHALTPDVLLQAIDSLIDLYADEEREYDVPVFRGGGMLGELEKRVGGVRAAIKKIDRNKFPDLRHRADGALENLVAFVQYRREVVKPPVQRRR
ncbi:hypothetical protein JCM8097_002713 [Rhodosporidiobolus ruineniae]